MGVNSRLTVDGKLAGDFSDECIVVSGRTPGPDDRIGNGEPVQATSADHFDCDVLAKPRKFRVLVVDRPEIEIAGYGVCSVAGDSQHMGILANAHDSSTFVAVFLTSQVIGIYPVDGPTR